MLIKIIFANLVCIFLFSSSYTQNILNVNRLSTTLFSPAAGEDFVVADVWGFTDEGREYAIVTRTEWGISIVDVTNPTQPVIASSIPFPAGAHNLYHAKYCNGYIYAVMRPGPLQIIDARNPYQAQAVAEYSLGFDEAYVIFISDTVAYLADVESTRPDVNLIALDISNPTNPVELGTWYRTYHHVFVRNDTLIGFAQKGEVDFLDVSDPSNIQNIFTIENTGSKTHSGWLHDHGELLTVDHELIGGHLALWDVKPLTSASLISEYSTSTNNEGETSLHHSRWYFDLIYMSYWQDCFRVVDASDPLNSQEVAVYDTIQPNPNTLYRGFWGCYPYLPSRNILVSDPKVGLIVLDYVNDGPGVYMAEIDTTQVLGNWLRGQFTQVNGNPIDTTKSYVYYRLSNQNSWMKSKIKFAGESDSFFFKIPLTASTHFVDYYLLLTDNAGKKTRVPGLAPSLDFYRCRTISYGSQIPEIFISEISDALNEQNAYLEIYNASGQDIDLASAKIVRCKSGSDNQYNMADYVFDLSQDESHANYSTIVPAYGFLLIANGSDQTSFENEWGALPANANFNPGNSNLQLGQGAGTRWTLLIGGNQNAFDGTIIDQTPTNVGGQNQEAYQQSPNQWVLTNDVSQATPGALGNDQSLPVELLSFKGTVIENKIKLFWETASEVNNLGFQILKATDYDGKFNLIGNYLSHPGLRSKGNSSVGAQYNFTDSDVKSGVKYQYILQSVSFSGQVHSLDTILVSNEKSPILVSEPILINTFPNPFNSQIKISITLRSPMESNPEIKIFDTKARLIKNFKLATISTTQFEFTWDGKDDNEVPISSGIYFLNVKSGKLQKGKKLLLIR